jgi:hypothetical protein
MKIIGTAVGRDRVLVDADIDELAMLTGYISNWYRKNDGKREIGVGDEISVNLLYDHYTHMKKVSSDIVRAKGILDAVSGGLTLADNLIRKPVEVQSGDKES